MLIEKWLKKMTDEVEWRRIIFGYGNLLNCVAIQENSIASAVFVRMRLTSEQKITISFLWLLYGLKRQISWYYVLPLVDFQLHCIDIMKSKVTIQ